MSPNDRGQKILRQFYHGFSQSRPRTIIRNCGTASTPVRNNGRRLQTVRASSIAAIGDGPIRRQLSGLNRFHLNDLYWGAKLPSLKRWIFASLRLRENRERMSIEKFGG